MKHKTKIKSRNEREYVIPVRQLTEGTHYRNMGFPLSRE
jgi:hypothetical protein